MSRIGRKPVVVPRGVTVQLQGNDVAVKGPRGELRRSLHPDMELALTNDQFTVARPTEEKRHKALHGLTRTLVQNMVEGVSKGFSKTLEIQGVGYKAEAKPYGINLIVGYSHPVKYEAPKGIKISVENNTTVKVEGAGQGAGRAGGGGAPVGAATGAVQGQGDSLPGRTGSPQGR